MIIDYLYDRLYFYYPYYRLLYLTIMIGSTSKRPYLPYPYDMIGPTFITLMIGPTSITLMMGTFPYPNDGHFPLSLW